MPELRYESWPHQHAFGGRKNQVMSIWTTIGYPQGCGPPDIANEAEVLGVERAAIDAALTSGTEGQARVALGERWDEALRWVTPRHVPRINGILRREDAPFRFDDDGEIVLMGGSYKQMVNRV